MSSRIRELFFLLIAGAMLGLAAWSAGNSGIAETTAVPILRCSPAELEGVLSHHFSEPALTVTRDKILTWRTSLTSHQRAEMALIDLVHRRILTAADLHALRPFWVAQEPVVARRMLLLYLGFLNAAFLLAHLIFRFSGFQGGQGMLPLLLLLTGTSTLLLVGFNDPLRDHPLYASFVPGVLVGCAGLVLMARFIPLGSLASFKYLTLLAALGLAAMLIVFGAGPAGTDARINLFGFFQPVEYVKMLVVVFLAAYFAGKDTELRRLHSVQLFGFSLPRWKDALPVAVGVAAMLALFFLQKDLGPAMILYLVFLGLFVITSHRFVLGLAGFAVLIGAFWASYRYRLLQTVATRIEMWLSPWDNHRPGGLQLAESVWALASGGLFGRGVGHAAVASIPAGHTDLILASAGETFGLVGVVGLGLLLGLLFVLVIGYGRTARSAFAAYLALGIALLLGIQTVIITGATVGLLPLTGVPVPFLSYGKSAIIAHFLLCGLALNVSCPAGGNVPRRLSGMALAIPALVVLAMGAVLARAGWVMGWDADRVLVRGALTPQSDGVRRYNYNRRIQALAAGIVRGDILDAHGLVLATSHPEEVPKALESLKSIGLGADAASDAAGHRGRYYTLGQAAVHLLGHTHGYWTDPRTVEHAADTALRGYPNADTVVIVDGRRIVKHDYSGLAPAFRDAGILERLRSKDRTVSITLDARMQVAALRALERSFPVFHGERRTKGAAVVLDAATGAILASVSLPAYDPNGLNEEDLDRIYGSQTKAGLDRARFEVYPPGSTFKVVTASAAVDSGLDLPTFECRHKDEIEWSYRGGTHRRLVTDDETESPHGRLDMGRALAESCNLYFAWAGTQIGPATLYEYARNRFRLEMSGVNRWQDLEPNLPDDSYGQAMSTASPLRMAAVAAAVANGGLRVEPFWMAGAAPAPVRILSESTTEKLRGWMLEVVEHGTGRSAAVEGVVMGGKTGTAQTHSGDGMSHSWFIGFVRENDSGLRRAIAFAFLIENGGYGAQAAAHAAHEFVAGIVRTGT